MNSVGRHKNNLLVIDCEYCEKPFLQKQRTQKFCSAKCRAEYHKKLAQELRKEFNSVKYEEVSPECIKNEIEDVFNNQSPYDNLKLGILKQAVIDYKKALKRRDSGKPPTAIYNVKSLEKFFLSDWGQFLSENGGEFIIEKVNQEHKKEQ